ncbi:MAG: anaerobic ribonucleoside-triphosphate reductase activating protein [Clostridiales bacterium]|jgi:pyruvate formate lyase activating enzyme|nr:anaerobic ribonucleoside-triphosphate reductase activating protein [Clostridiales bacterium]
MKICGLQKLSLLDFPGRLGCTVFIGGCNFRCPFCHNAPLVVGDYAEQEISQGQFFDFLDGRAGIIEGVCVTGGEPLSSDGIFEFLRGIKNRGFAVKIDTNGSFPSRLGRIIDERLADYAAMDIKNSPEKYRLSVGVNADVEAVKDSAARLMSGGLPFEFRTTLVKEFNTLADMQKIGTWLKGPSPYFLQTFRPSENVISQNLSPWTEADTLKAAEILKEYMPNAQIRKS